MNVYLLCTFCVENSGVELESGTESGKMCGKWWVNGSHQLESLICAPTDVVADY